MVKGLATQISKGSRYASSKRNNQLEVKLLSVMWCMWICLCFLKAGADLEFNLQPFNSPQLSLLTNSTLLVDSMGRIYVIAKSQLLRLNRDLQLEQNVSLSGNGATFSLSSDDQRLFVCVNGMTDRSCYLYNPSDLTVPPVATGVSIVGSGGATATSFSTEGSFYVGSYEVMVTNSSVGRMELSQYIYGDGTGTPMIRTEVDYIVLVRVGLIGECYMDLCEEIMHTMSLLMEAMVIVLTIEY